MKRRRFLSILGMASLPLPFSTPGLWAAEALAKQPNHDFASFDLEIEGFMQARHVPGGALAVVKDGRLVYSRGYGWGDREKQEAARPDSLFRLASLSKPITSIAVMKLVEARQLDLRAKVLDLIKLEPLIDTGSKPDARWQQITVEHLLHHTGGWDRDKSFDPMFRPLVIAQAAGIRPPATSEAIIRYMRGKPLDFDPGTRYAYSNFGYCLLGRIIEQVTGMAYAKYVKKEVLSPLGISRMAIGASLLDGQVKDEVHYYTPANRSVKSVFPSSNDAGNRNSSVPDPYGGFYLEAMDSHGGWIASVLDLARITAALDDTQHSPLLKPISFQAMYERPAPPAWRNQDGSLTDHYYGCGWLVRPMGKGKADYWHPGSLPGTYTLWVRRHDGISWMAFFNQCSNDAKLPDTALDPAMHRAAAGVSHWPMGEALLDAR